MRIRNASVPRSEIIMLAISLASPSMRTVSHAGALPPWSGRLAMPVRYITLQFSMVMIAYFGVILLFFTLLCINAVHMSLMWSPTLAYSGQTIEVKRQIYRLFNGKSL